MTRFTEYYDRPIRATCLEELRDELNELHDLGYLIHMEDLPTFGGGHPDGVRVLSWDKTRVLWMAQTGDEFAYISNR